MKDQILYIFDPLCGWCYGFSQTIYDFYKAHSENLDFVPIVGGMVTGDRIGPAAKMYDYISGAIPRLEQTTGCKVTQTYLEVILSSQEVIMNSEPPCRAVVAFRSIKPDQSMTFVKALQYAHYGLGRDYNLDSTYASLLAQFDVSEQAFFSAYESKEILDITVNEFDWVQKAGVRGFPATVLKQGDQYTMLASGYTSIEQLNSTLQKVLTTA
ncbi:MAG: putative protein-disulfide isomerase [Cyclobacteriaceae bacterium]|jgi:putative protein-disulfide isomerase